MPKIKLTEELQKWAYILVEDYSIIKNVSNIMLKNLEDGDLTEIELQCLMHTLNDKILSYNKQLQNFIKSIEFGS